MIHFILIIAFTAFAQGQSTSVGTPVNNAEVEVKLFGQPCVLVGPLTKVELKLIHSISPEQLPSTHTLKQCQEMIEKLKNARAIPKQLEPYRDQTLEYARAWEAFHRGQTVARRKKYIKTWTELVRPFLNPKDIAEFESLTPTAAPEVISEFYRTHIKASPEHEFHRVLKILRVHYQCSFEEGSE